MTRPPPALRGRTWTVGVLLTLLAADLLSLVVTGGSSLLGRPVGPAGFASRLGLMALGLLALRLVTRKPDGYTLALCLLLLPSLQVFQFAGGRINGDGFFYYVQLRSLWKDGDVQFENEYRHYELTTRPELRQPLKSGYYRNNFSVGPAILWSPFFGLGELVGRVQGWLGGDPDLSGYGPLHRNATALGSLLLGFAAVLLVQSVLRRHFDRPAAFAGAALMGLASGLPWYMVQQPTMSHAASTFVVTFLLWLWDRDHLERGLARAALLGLALGLAMSVRWQNAVFLLLPAWDVIRRRGDPRQVVTPAAALAAGALIGVLPQVLVWKAIFGQLLLTSPPQGTSYIRWTRPFVAETLFSSRHGLLSWTPALWLGFLGVGALVWRRRGSFVPLGLCLLGLTYVNMCVADWWAGGSYSNRRFDAALPLLAFGIALAFDALRRGLARAPALAAGALLSGFVLWNVLLMAQYRGGGIPRDETVSFSQLASGNLQLLFDTLGAPLAWPANWLFAWRHGVPVGQYDLLAGRYLFYGNDSLGGVVELGGDDGGLLGEGWGRTERRDRLALRVVEGEIARLFAPLEEPEDLEVGLRLYAERGTPELVLEVNGVPMTRLRANPGFDEYAVRVPAAAWRRGINRLDLRVARPTRAERLLVDRVVFRRLPAARVAR